MQILRKCGEVEMKEYIVPDDFLNAETIASAEGQGYLHEIVRCNDCKHLEHLAWLDEKNGEECYVCRKHSFTGMRSPDWFCADGERR